MDTSLVEKYEVNLYWPRPYTDPSVKFIETCRKTNLDIMDRLHPKCNRWI